MVEDEILEAKESGGLSFSTPEAALDEPSTLSDMSELSQLAEGFP